MTQLVCSWLVCSCFNEGNGLCKFLKSFADAAFILRAANRLAGYGSEKYMHST